MDAADLWRLFVRICLALLAAFVGARLFLEWRGQ
jgi:hypothetical protein